MKNLMKKIDRLFTAITFAEAKAHDHARKYLEPQRAVIKKMEPNNLKSFLTNVGLDNVKVYYGVAAI